MIDHLSGNHREFFDPDKAYKAICDTTTMEARVTDTLRLPVVNHGFLRPGDRISFTAHGLTGDGTLVEVAHQGVFVCGDRWVGSTTVDDTPTDVNDPGREAVFHTELAVNGWPVARTRIRVCGCRGRFDSSGDGWEAVETTVQDTGWFLVRLIGRVADANEMTSDSQIRIRWGDLYAWYSQRGSTGSLHNPPRRPLWDGAGDG